MELHSATVHENGNWREFRFVIRSAAKDLLLCWFTWRKQQVLRFAPDDKFLGLMREIAVLLMMQAR